MASKGGARAGAGRKPKLTSVSRLPVNNPRAKAEADKAAADDKITELVNPPTDMCDGAQAVWFEVQAQLIALGQLKRRDLYYLEVLADAVHLRRSAMREVESMGINITTDKGDIKRNPACGVVNECASKIQSYGGELGLSPVARSRLEGASGSQAQDDFSDF